MQRSKKAIPHVLVQHLSREQDSRREEKRDKDFRFDVWLIQLFTLVLIVLLFAAAITPHP